MYTSQGYNYNVPQQQNMGYANPYNPNQIQNPMASVQNRINQYDQQAAYQAQQAQQQQQLAFASPQIRMVTGIEEVRAISVPFDGSTSYFHNKANGEIYTKMIDLNGLPQIQTYKLDSSPIAPPSHSIKQEDFVLKTEFQKEFEELKKQIQKYEIIYEQLMGKPKASGGGMADE